MFVVQFFTGRHEVKIRSRAGLSGRRMSLSASSPGDQETLSSSRPFSFRRVFVSPLDFRIAKAEAFLRVNPRWLEALASTADCHHPLPESLPSLQRGAVGYPFLTRVPHCRVLPAGFGLADPGSSFQLSLSVLSTRDARRITEVT